ncbi:hypothetical protein KDA11_00235 [Candidatus Saccharibacteria bacterium]|nr:hypothetical protein [Candidatus Saccharibacteria bacterium]
MDTTPDSQPTRIKLDTIPVVRKQWNIPVQRLWAQRIWQILINKNPNLTSVIDTATYQATRNVEAELGIDTSKSDICLSTEEWQQATKVIAHAAGAAAIYATAEALSEINNLEKEFNDVFDDEG